MYKFSMILMAILATMSLKAEHQSVLGSVDAEILYVQDNHILVNSTVSGNRLILKSNLPSEVIFKITSTKGDLLATGKSNGRIININGLSKGNYFLEINIEGETIKQLFSVLY